MPRRPSLFLVSGGFGGSAQETLSLPTQKADLFSASIQVLHTPAGCPIFLPGQAMTRRAPNPTEEADWGRSCEQIGTAPPTRSFRAGLHGFRFLVRAGVRGGLRTPGAATEGLCSFSLSRGWKQVEVGAKSIKKTEFPLRAQLPAAPSGLPL
jgi:hypothetical protein